MLPIASIFLELAVMDGHSEGGKEGLSKNVGLLSNGAHTLEWSSIRDLAGSVLQSLKRQLNNITNTRIRKECLQKGTEQVGHQSVCPYMGTSVNIDHSLQ